MKTIIFNFFKHPKLLFNDKIEAGKHAEELNLEVCRAVYIDEGSEKLVGYVLSADGINEVEMQFITNNKIYI